MLKPQSNVDRRFNSVTRPFDRRWFGNFKTAFEIRAIGLPMWRPPRCRPFSDRIAIGDLAKDFSEAAVLR